MPTSLRLRRVLAWRRLWVRNGRRPCTAHLLTNMLLIVLLFSFSGLLPLRQLTTA